MAAPSHRTLLPHPTRFVGRREELRRLEETFERGARLVSVLGAPGMGKTRLARRHAELAPAAVFCDLSGAVTHDDICRAVLGALDEALPGRLSAEGLSTYVGEVLDARGPLLVVLDNFEQVVGHGTSTVGRWLRAAPEARFLVTTRERLRLTGERVFELGHLGLGDGDTSTSDAVELFVDRARAAGAGHLGESDPRALAEIVRLLDGIPLAIELAAARAVVLDLGEMRRWLTARLALLARSPRDTVGRQATLRAAIDWSWNLLSGPEQGALAACSVFRGGFSLDAGRAVLTRGGSVEATLELVEALHAKSLLRIEAGSSGPRRFGMYLSIREYAAEKLASRPSGRTARTRHARYFLALGAEWADRMARTGDLEAQRLLALEQENLLAIARGDHERMHVAQATLALDPLLRTQGPYDDHLVLLDRPLEDGAGGKLPAGLRAALLAARGEAHRRRGHFADGVVDLHRAVDLSRAARDPMVEGRARASLGMVHHQSGRLEEAETESEQALVLHRRAGDARWERIARNTLGLVSFAKGRLEEAQRQFDEVLVLARAGNDAWAEGITYSFAGEVRQERGLFEEAAEHLRRSAACAERVSDGRSLGLALGYLAGLEHETGETERSLATYDRALEMLGWHSEGRYGGLFRARACAAAADADRLEEAVALLDAARPVLRALGDAALERALELHGGHVDLCRARQATSRHDAASAARHLAAAQALSRAEDARDREDVRFAARMLARATEATRERVEAIDDDRALHVAEDGSSFCPPGGTRVGLERRRALCRLLSALGRQRLEAPGVPLAATELVREGWPGERMHHESGVARLRVAVGTLRDLGLRGLLLTRGDGYVLDPGVPLRRR